MCTQDKKGDEPMGDGLEGTEDVGSEAGQTRAQGEQGSLGAEDQFDELLSLTAR